MQGIIDKTERFSTDLLTNKLDHNFLYHNLTHTKRIVQDIEELVDFFKFRENEKEE